MINYTYTLENQAGQQVKFNDFNTDPANFIALQQYPVFDLDVKHSELDKEGQHGIWDFFSFYGKRVITFTGVIIGEDEGNIEDMKQLLTQVLSLPSQPLSGNDGTIVLKWNDANGDAWQINGCKMERIIRFDRPMKRQLQLGFTITLKSASPFIVSQDAQVYEGTRGWQSGGTQIPFLLPLILTFEYQNVLNVTNIGSIESHSVIRMYGTAAGTLTNPRIWNRTTGKTFTINRTLADETEYLEIDSEAGTVVDQDGVDRSGDVDPGSEYTLVAAGLNEFIYLTDESLDSGNPLNTSVTPSGEFTVTFRRTTV